MINNLMIEILNNIIDQNQIIIKDITINKELIIINQDHMDNIKVMTTVKVVIDLINILDNLINLIM